MFSLPIPQDDEVTYGDLRCCGIDIGQLVKDLTDGRLPKNRIGANTRAHFDPDINFNAYAHRKRRQGWKDWRGVFGQVNQANTHLRNEGVDVGDLFLFFGLYRRVEETQDGWRFTGAVKQHVLWGWLQIGEIHDVGSQTKSELPWAHHHPHVGYGPGNNTLYIASDALDVGNKFKAPGAGLFPKFHDELVLTEPRAAERGTWSYWRLPLWFHPEGKKMLTWQGNNMGRWDKDDDWAYLQSVPRGQEFVLHLEDYPEALDWASNLIRDHGQS